MDTGILRQATEAEKRDFIPIGEVLTLDQQFRREMHAKESECTRQHKPFDRKGAYYDYEDKKKALMDKLIRVHGDGAHNLAKYEDLKMDLNEYSKPTRFKLLDETEVREDKLLDGIRVSVITGKWLNYQCAEHKGRISVFLPLQSIKSTEDLEKTAKNK